MTNDNKDIDFPGVSVDESDPEHVSEFRTKDHYPDEVAEQWDDIRAGTIIAVDDTGHIVESLSDAEQLLHPNYMMDALPSSLTGASPDSLPPVGYTPVGEPDFDDSDFEPQYQRWIDPETSNVLIGNGETKRVVARLNNE